MGLSLRQIRYLYAIGVFKKPMGGLKGAKKLGIPHRSSPKPKKAVTTRQAKANKAQKLADAHYDALDSISLTSGRPAFYRQKGADPKWEREWVKEKTKLVVNEIESRLSTIPKDKLTVQSQAIHAVLREASGHNGETSVTIEIAKDVVASKNVQSRLNGSVDWVNSVRPAGAEPMNITLAEVVPSGRAYAIPENKELYMTARDQPLIYVHELAHVLETQSPHVPKVSIEYRDRNYQTDGPERKISEITNNSIYDDDEVGYPARLGKEALHAYLGKVYDDTATEVFSMGLERMYDNPARLRQEAPDLFETTIRALYHS